MRIAFVHTNASLVDRFRTLVNGHNLQAETFHILNEGLMQSLRNGAPRQLVYGRTVRQLGLAIDEGADLVVLTCASTSPAVDIARAMSLAPIINANDPLAAEAVRLGRRIGIISTNTTSPGPTANLLRVHAAAQGREVIIETLVRSEAHTARFAGDTARHDSILLAAAQDIAARVDVIILSQATLADLQQPMSQFGKPTLASPPLLMAELTRRLRPDQGRP